MSEDISMPRQSQSKSTVPRLAARAALLVGLAVTLSLTGCNGDSWMNPSVVGRWEYTPTVVPILERIDVIERDQGDFLETTAITPEDLIPEITDYRVGPGDSVFMEIFDFLQAGVPTPFERQLDARASVDLPQLGRIDLYDLTADEIREKIISELKEQGIIEDALVSVQIIGRRQATFSVYGAIAGVGRYLVPVPDYRLLEAVSEAGGLSDVIKKIYVIRQVSLSDDYSRGTGAPPRGANSTSSPNNTSNDPGQDGVDLDDLIRRLSNPEDAPGQLASENTRRVAQAAPPIDLIEAQAPRQSDDRRNVQTNRDSEPGSWIFLNDRWVRVDARTEAQGLAEGDDPLGDSIESLVTQRIIEIPVGPLLEGDPRYNIVVRPGDIIRVPSPDQGLVYLAGPGIARPGIYSLPSNGRLTLSKAVLAAGGLSGLAIPWRVDLTRMVGEDRQATVRLDLRAIAEGTQPDIFLKPDDMINVGTNFWAVPLAVIRGGFRASYGYGFILDRNFGNDVFGAPPSNIRR